MIYIKQTLQGISWIAALRYSSRVLAVVQAAILARFFLTPYEFGLFGIASLVLAFLEIVTETGINVFLIQKQESIDTYVSSAWFVSIFRGIAISLLLVVTAPMIVSFYNSSGVYQLLLLMSFVPFVRGFINPSIIRYQKELDFHKEFYMRMVIFCVSFGVTLLTAYIYNSAISLVLGLLAAAGIEVVLSFVFIKPVPHFSFQKAKVKEVLHHGKWVTVYGIFSYFSQETDDIVLGKVLGVPSLGSYQLAYKLGTLPITEITEVVQKVLFPIYAKISMHKEQLRKTFVKMTGTISTIVVLFGIVLFTFSFQIVQIILGDKWFSIVPVFQILVIYGVIRAISGLSVPLLLAGGKQRFVATATFFRFAGLAITIVPFLMVYGINGAGYASIVSAICELPILLYYLKKELYEK